MDARSRIGPKMSAKTRPSNGLVRGQAANRKRSTTFTAANGKPKNSVTGRTASIRNSKFDASRLNFGGKGREALDLRNVLQDKKDEEERKKRFAANLQSRLGLQSRAAREEVKKQLNSARKVDSQKVTTTNTSKATAVKSSVILI